jgi:hypothetical protein
MEGGFDMERMLSRAEVGDRLGIPPATLAAWASAGSGPRYFRVGRHARYREVDVIAWLELQARVPGEGRAA